MSLQHQTGVKKETTYGTAVVVDRFFEVNSGAPAKVETGRSVSAGLRRGQRVVRKDRAVPYVLGATLTRELDVLNSGFGFWLEHMLGAVATTGPADTTAYTHTGTIDDLEGTSFTYQENVPLGASGNTDQAFTYEGGKIAKWTLSCETEGLLVASFDMVFEDYTTATALATASYPAAATVPLSWADASATIGGTSVPVTKWSVSCDNKLKTDRHYLANGTRRSEPVEEDLREITVEVECDWSALTQWNRHVSEVVADNYAAIILSAKAPTLIAGAATTYPELRIDLDAVRFDDVDPDTIGPGMTMQTIKGVATDNGTDEPIEVRYVTVDTTP